MKKNYSVNIGGQLFNIDEDALRRLEEYFTRLRGYFGGNGEAAEMLADVEARIAELLMPLSRGSERVVDMAAIETVIDQMGEPEEWGASGDDPDLDAGRERGRKNRRIFRDADHRILGGVASGLAAWSGLDPMVVRVLFILFTLFYFTGLIVYAVLWLVLPEARTTSEKLEMYGEEVNVDNLKRRFNEEKQRLAELGEHLPKNEDVRRFTRDFGHGLGRLVRFGLNLFLRMFGVILLLMVLGLAIGFSVAIFARDSFYFDGGLHFVNLNLFQVSQYLIPHASLRWQMYVAAGIASVALIGLLAYWGLKLLIQWKNSTWQIPSVLGLLLATALMLGAVFAFRYQEQTRVSRVKAYNYYLGSLSPKKFRIRIDDRRYTEMLTKPGIWLFSGKEASTSDDFFEGWVDYNFYPAAGDSLKLVLNASARGKSTDEAARNLQTVRYYWAEADSTLTLDRKFSVPLRQGYYQQHLEVNVYIPVSAKVFVRPGDVYEINYDSFAQGTERTGGWYQMTRDGLQPVADTLQRLGQ